MLVQLLVQYFKSITLLILYVLSIYIFLIGCHNSFTIQRSTKIPTNTIRAQTTGPILLNQVTSQSTATTNTVWSYNIPVSNWNITKETIFFTDTIPFSISTIPSAFYTVESNSCTSATVSCSMEYHFNTVVTPGSYQVALGQVLQNNIVKYLNYNILFTVSTIPTRASIVVQYTPHNYNPNYIANQRTWHTNITNQTGEMIRLATNMGPPDIYATFATNQCQQTEWAPNAVCSFDTILNVQHTTVGYGRSGLATIYNRWGQRVIQNIAFAFQGVTNPTIMVSVSSLSLTSPGVDIQTTTHTGIAYQGVVSYTNTNPDPMGQAIQFSPVIPVSGPYFIGTNHCNVVTLAFNQVCTVSILVYNTNTPGIYTQSLGNFVFQNLEQAQTHGGFTTQATNLTIFTSFDPISSQDLSLTTSSNVSFDISNPSILEAGVSTTMTLLFTNTDISGTMRHFTYHTTPVSGVIINNGCQAINLAPRQSCVVTLSISVPADPVLLIQPVGSVSFNNVASTLITKRFSNNIFIFTPTQPTIVVSSSFSTNPVDPNYYAVRADGIATTGTLTYTNVSAIPYLVGYNFIVNLASHGVFVIHNHCSNITLAPGQFCTIGIQINNTPFFGPHSISCGTLTYNNRIHDFTQTFATENHIYFLGNLDLVASPVSQISVQQALPTTFYTTLSTGIITTMEVRFINQSLDPKQVLNQVQFSQITTLPFSMVHDGCTGTILNQNTYCRVVYAVNNTYLANLYSQPFGTIQGTGRLTTSTFVSLDKFYTNFIDTPLLLAGVVSTLSTNSAMPTYFYVTPGNQILNTVALTYTNQSAGLQPMTNFTVHLTVSTNMTILSNGCNNTSLNTVAMGGTQFCTVQILFKATQYGQTIQSLGTATYNMSGHTYAFTNTTVLYAIVSTPPEVVISISTILSQNMLAPTDLEIATNGTTTTKYTVVFTNISDEPKEIAKNFVYVTQATTQYSIIANTCQGQTLATQQSCTVTIQLTIPTRPTIWTVPLGFASFKDLNGLSFNTPNQTVYIEFTGPISFTIATYTGLSRTEPGTAFMNQNMTSGQSSIATIVTVVYTNTALETANNIGLVGSLYNEPWSILTNTCIGNLAPNASCTASIRLTRPIQSTKSSITLPGILGLNPKNIVYVETNKTVLYARFIAPFISYSVISTLSTVSNEPTVFSTKATDMTINKTIIWYINTSTEFTATNIAVPATIATQFTIQNNCVDNLAPSSSCSIVLNVIATASTTGTIMQQIPNIQYSALDQNTIQNNVDNIFYIIFSNAWIVIQGNKNHTCGINQDYRLYCWGNNGYGKLGIGTIGGDYPTPQLISTASFINLSVGDSHTCAIDIHQKLYCWGWNQYGQTGLGTFDNFISEYSTPQLVSNNQFIDLSLGQNFTCAIDINQKLYCWGQNNIGQLGLGTSNIAKFGLRLVSTASFTNVSAGDNHTCAINKDKQLYCWGKNYNGQLGIGTDGWTDQHAPYLLTLASVSAIALGGQHTCAINMFNQLYCWGDNVNGQLGIGTLGNNYSTPKLVSTSSFISVSSGFLHTCAVNMPNQLYCWGDNGDGRLGIGTIGGNYPTPQLVITTDFIRLSLVRGDHTCALKTIDKLYCWGDNTFGQLGFGDTSDRPSPTLLHVIF
jgi:alpha-tubulin suppressor-like RCC1 family protein